MRVTNSLFYTNAANDYQRNMQELYKTNTQISSGLKIQNSFEDSGTYVDAMRLNYEVATLDQSKESSTKAKTYTDNTDQVLNQFTDSLNQFKTLMIQASNATNSSTSLNAIANELEGLQSHLKSLGNTSINGNFLFSGTATQIKPINTDGSYAGNDGNMEAMIGSGVKLPYNMSGKELFLGTDSDYHRVVSTNVQMLNQSKLHPDVMVENSGVTASEKVYLTAEDTIRDMVGDTNNATTNPSDVSNLKDPNAVFHLSGRRPDGSTFNTNIEMKSHEKVSELLTKIGEEFGNTPTNKVVDVQMNEHGQIEVKDLKVGNQLLEMHIVGAVDRNTLAGSEGTADNAHLIAQNNVQVIKFQKSDFIPKNSESKISSRQDIYTPGQFTLGAPMYTANGNAVNTYTKLQSFMGDEINQIKLSGKDNSGTNIDPIPPNDVLRIDSDTTVQNLLSSVENAYGVSARLEDGQIYMQAGSSTDFDANKLEVNLDAYKFAGDGEVQSIEIQSDSNAEEDIKIKFQPSGNSHNIHILANISKSDVATQIADYFTANPPAAEDHVASVRADGDSVIFDYTEDGGDIGAVELDPNGTGVTAGATSTDATYIPSGLSEVQSFDIKKDPTDDGTITIEGFDIDFLSTDTAADVAQKIKDKESDIKTANPNISSVSNDNGKVTFTYESSAGNVDNASITISQTAGTDDLTITNQDDRTVTQGSGAELVNAFTTFDALSYDNYNFQKDGDTLSSNVSQMVKNTNEFATAKTKLSEVAGVDSQFLDNRYFEFDFINKNGVQSQGKINLQETLHDNKYSTFQIDFDNSGTYEDNETYSLFDTDGKSTKASDVTYQQVMDVLTLALNGTQPIDKDSFDTSVNPPVFNTIADGDLFAEYESTLKSARNNIDVHLNGKGQMVVVDKKNSDTKMQLSLNDHSKLLEDDKFSAFNFMANDAVKIEDPTIDLYKSLDDIIKAVKNGEMIMSADNNDPRSLGLNNSLTMINHLMDHVSKSQTKIGAYSNALSQANQRSELLSVNVQTIRSEVIDVDVGEAYMKFNQLSNSYQAMLSTVAKINSMTLLNYM